MTKLEIIQRLLDNKHIDAKEAIALLEKEIQYVYQPNWVYPQPFYYDPYKITYYSPSTVTGTTNNSTIGLTSQN